MKNKAVCSMSHLKVSFCLKQTSPSSPSGCASAQGAPVRGDAGLEPGARSSQPGSRAGARPPGGLHSRPLRNVGMFHRAARRISQARQVFGEIQMKVPTGPRGINAWNVERIVQLGSVLQTPAWSSC